MAKADDRLRRLVSDEVDDCCEDDVEARLDDLHALSELTDAELVARRKDGKWRYYRTTDRAERLLAALSGEFQ